MRTDSRQSWSIILELFISIIFVVRTAEKEEIEEVLDQITKENGLLKENAERADVLAEVIHELMPDDE